MHFNVKISKNRLWSNIGKHDHRKNRQKIGQCEVEYEGFGAIHKGHACVKEKHAFQAVS